MKKLKVHTNLNSFIYTTKMKNIYIIFFMALYLAPRNDTIFYVDNIVIFSN